MDFGLIVDFISHRKEYATLGQNGERHLYRELRKVGAPKDALLRNVYIPLENGKTTEIDVLVVSRKGLLVFEHKTYNGMIYGDGNQEKWVQYLGGKKFYFWNPIKQNEYHVKKLREYLTEEAPIYGFVSHSACGKWKIRNVPDGMYFLNRKGDFLRIYSSLPDNEEAERKMHDLREKLAKLSRPTDGTRERHVKRFGK